MPFTIRSMVPEDIPALSLSVSLQVMPGIRRSLCMDMANFLVWALPYVLLPPETAQTWVFVLADDAAPVTPPRLLRDTCERSKQPPREVTHSEDSFPTFN